MPWEEEVPAWSGVVGNTLIDAAKGFSQALLDMPKERLAREKDALELDRLRSQITLDKARADYETRRGSDDDLVKTSWGVYRRNPATNTLELLSEKPAAGLKPLTPGNQMKAQAIKWAEQYFGKPFSAFGDAEFAHPKWQEMADVFGNRPDVMLGPDGMPLTRKNVRRDASGQPIPEPPAPAGEKPAEPTRPVVAPADLRPGLQKIADKTGARLEDLERVIAFETRGTFSPDARNPRSGATGYIQFTRDTAERLGTTVEAIGKMSQEEQLALVERYLMPYKGRIGTLQDLYLAIFAPSAIGKGGNEVLYSQKDHPKAYDQNRELDKDNKGYITAADATEAVRRHGGGAGSQPAVPPPEQRVAGPGAPKATAPPPEKPPEKPPPGTPTRPLVANPNTVEWQVTQWQKKTPELVDQEMDLLIKAPAWTDNPADLLSRVEAYKQLRGKEPPGWRAHPLAKRLAAGQGVTPAQPSPPTQLSVPSGGPQPPQAQPTGPGSPPPPEPKPGQIPATQYRTPAQQQKDQTAASGEARAQSHEQREWDEHGWKYQKAILDQDANARAQWQQARLARLDKTLHPTPDQARIANDLWTLGEVRPETMGFYPDLDPFEKAKVNAIQQQPLLAEERRRDGDFIRRQSAESRADRREHLEAMGKNRPLFQELGALDTTKYLTTQIIPLLDKQNIGIWGKLSAFEQAMGENFGYRQNEFFAEIDKQLQKAGLVPNINTAAGKTALVHVVETTDPKVREQFRMVSAQSRLQTLSSLLMYAHAIAAKRIAGGTDRGLIASDMEEAHKLFNPTLWYSNPKQLLANLQELQNFIQNSRPKIEEMIRAQHINPDTKLLIKRDYEDKPGAVPATQLVRPSGAGTPPQTEQEYQQILQGGTR